MRSLILVALLGLSACAFKQRVQMFTQADIANAAAIAQASGDKTGADCWVSLEPVVAPAPNPNAEGLATVAERDRLLHATVGGPCGSVLAPKLLQIVTQIPSAAAPLFGLPVP